MIAAAHDVDAASEEMDHEPFSLAAARHIVRDLFTHRPLIYWVDFLTSVLLGYVTFGLSRRWDELLPLVTAAELPGWLSLSARIFIFVCSCLLNFRAVNFIHEVVHLPVRKFWLFNATWILLCGILFLWPLAPLLFDCVLIVQHAQHAHCVLMHR